MATIWMPDAPPASAGADDDEFADNSGAVPGGWTEFDHGTHSTPIENTQGMTLEQATHAGESVAGIYKSIPAGDFTIWCKLALSGIALTNTLRAGLVLLEDATNSAGDMVLFGLTQNATEVKVVQNTHTAYNATPTETVARVISVDVAPNDLYLRIRRTGTTYAFDFSTDGLGWSRIQSATIAFTPVHYGVALSNVATGQNAKATFKFFRYLASDVGLTGTVGGDRVLVGAA